MDRVRLWLFIRCYATILGTGQHLIPLLFFWHKKRVRWDIAPRSSMPTPRYATTEPTVWIHAASLGESKLVATFLAILNKQNSHKQYLLTATTRAGVSFLNSLPNDNIHAVGFLPFDTPGLMHTVLKQFRVKRVWLMETELWPVMLDVCRRSNIPVGIVNARIEEKSFRLYRQFIGWLRPLFKSLSPVLAQNTTYAQRYLSLGVNSRAVTVTGNLKSLISIIPVDPLVRSHLRAPFSISPTTTLITAGSLHPGEGEIVRDALSILRKEHGDVRMIVVPRHIDKAERIIEELGSNSVLLDSLSYTGDAHILCIARLGILADMYRLANAAIIGGTFVPIGGHNVWEAAQCGIPVVFGPQYHTQQSSCTQLIGAGIGKSVTSASELAATLSSMLFAHQDTFLNNRSEFQEILNKQDTQIEHYLPGDTP